MMTLPVTELDEVEGPPSFGQKLRRVLLVPGRILGALFLPDRTMPQVVAEKRYAAPILFVICTGLFAGWAIGQRLDMSFMLTGPGPGGPGGGGQQQQQQQPQQQQQQQMSDREVDEMMQKGKTQAQVMMGIDAAVVTPFKILALALALLLVGRYVGGKTSALGALTAASNAALPFGVKSLLVAGAALTRTAVTPMELPELLPFSAIGPGGGGPLKFLVFDPFMLWTVVLLGFGLYAASHLTKRRAFVAVLVCFGLFQLLSGGAGPDMPGPGGPMMQGPKS
jgi:hypothetical protein